MRYTVLVLAAALVVTLGWRGVRWTMHDARSRGAGIPDAYSSLPPTPTAASAALWQRDFAGSLDAAATDAGAGNISSAEMAVDRADTLLTAARLQSRTAPPDFFAASLAQLDQVLQKHPGDARLLEHVTLARVSLAELASSLSPADTADAKGDVSAPGIIHMSAPRELTASQTLGPKSFGGMVLDATPMPDTAEILLPPSSRAFADNIRVENLTIAGASQTLDGIRWRNVTFVGTRLRYEGGELDLQSVHFVRCRFGFTTDDRGARLATAIASTAGRSSITITIE